MKLPRIDSGKAAIIDAALTEPTVERKEPDADSLDSMIDKLMVALRMDIQNILGEVRTGTIEPARGKLMLDYLKFLKEQKGKESEEAENLPDSVLEALVKNGSKADS